MDNLLGVHALVFSGGTQPEDVARIVPRAAAAGYGLVEFSLHDCRPDAAPVIDTAGTRALLEQHGLQVAASRGLAVDADVSSEDPAVVERGVELVRHSMQVTHELGGRIVTGALYSAFGKAGAPLTDQGRANVVASLRQVAGEAAELGMTLGLEICNRYETNVLNTAADALRLADDIGADNVMIHLDTYHMNIEETDLVSPVLAVGDRLGYVHVGENHRGHLGGGHIDFPAFFRALASIGYAGPITFESFSDAVVMRSLSNDLAIWRTLWTDSDELAAHAYAMITGWQTAAV
ncbi:sugar phosphate isomerase/epimerase family protein [Propionibacteriaceae bacterium Y1700]|uniref:sugar phosphate isomerase/epimerase family protein n=1 Tax=Microlunatus sp. Y1700 TaxID=3418487 RepID=UPI003DA7896F